MQETNILEEKVETASEFLDILRNSNERWVSKHNKWETAWVFRGQSDANLRLIPSAWRSEKLDRFKQKYRSKFENIFAGRYRDSFEEIAAQMEQGEITVGEGEEKTNSLSTQVNISVERAVQYFAEMQAVKEFTEFADKLGYPVPGANEFIVLGMRNYRNLSQEDYLISQFAMPIEYNKPFNVNCSAVALAQHHGIPTRLLDWTEHPFMAAFFAAEAFTSKKDTNEDYNLQEGKIAVWAISKEIFSLDMYSKHPTSLQLIAIPRHEIDYLHAQKGVFTLDKEANEAFLETGEWRSVEDIIGDNPEYLRKITLPVQEVGELLRLLWLEGISRAHLMPTYDNITRALETKAWWEKRA